MDFTMPALPAQTLDTPLLLDLQALAAAFAAVPDLRGRRGVRYRLDVLLTLAVLAKLAGYSQLRAMADWAHLRQTELTTLLGLARPTLPHPTTWSRVFARGLDPAALDRVIRDFWTRTQAARPRRGRWIQVSIDGKTLRGTIPLGATQGVHLVAAFLPQTGIVLAQLVVRQKANELTVTPQLLGQITLTGVVVTGDALFAQRSLSAQIVAAGGEYIWQVRRNQPELYDDIAWLLAPLRADEQARDYDFRTYTSLDKGHGRLEERRIRVSSMLAGSSDWPGLAQVFAVTSRITDGRGRTTEEVRYGVTSRTAAEASPAALLAFVRAHWRQENGLHYRRDVTLGEDRSQVRLGQAPQVLASLNNVVIGVAARQAASNLAALQRRVAYQFDKALQVAMLGRACPSQPMRRCAPCTQHSV
jgi:predicted transposase YbfD/YdcC